MKRLVVLVIAAGCGSDAPSGPELVDVSSGTCIRFDQPRTFTTGADFAPAERGSLAGWDIDGRWFLPDAPSGPSSVRLERRGAQVIVDGNAAAPGQIDDTEIVQRAELAGAAGTAVTTTRISNHRADGSARLERATCLDAACTLCTVQLVRATHAADEGEAEGLARLGELADPAWSGYTFNVRVAGTLAYLIRSDGLHIIETADPAHPVELGHYRRAELGYSNDVKLITAGDRRYAVIADTPVDVVDVTSPRTPVLAAQIAESAHTVFVEVRGQATLAYFGGLGGTCPVYDVTDPQTPQLLGRFDAGAPLVHDLSVDGGIAYLSAWSKGFLVVDFTTPAEPRLVGSWAPTPIRTSHSNWTTRVAGRHVALHGDEGRGARLDVVDVDPASPAFMTPIASWQTRPWISIHNIMAFGARAYLTYYQDGVRVLDVSDPRAPVQIGYYNTWDPQGALATSAFYEGAVGLDVDPVRKLIFVADTPRGLIILADTTP